MSSPAGRGSKVQPAQLSFLAIYNPSLGPTDETFRDQVVFYYSRATVTAKAKRRGEDKEVGRADELHEQENEKLRQIGLAQGMVDFARSFSNGQPVDSIETEKSRIVLRELEPGWWILASVDLTRLPGASASSSTSRTGDAKDEAPLPVEYSTREVSPPALLLQNILRAHSIFSLHHGPSLNALYTRLTRLKFCNILDRFWTQYAHGWDVLMHGNPAADIFGGLKLAAGGELGFGVGEEDWGSGEREVLEDVTGRTEGLVDIVVSRFGELPEQQAADSKSTISKNTSSCHDAEIELWMGNGRHPGAADGVIFSGVGNISRSSLRDLSDWMASIYTHGDHAYGVADNPNRDRRKRRRRSPPDTFQAPPNTRTDSKPTMKGDVNYRPPPNAKVNMNVNEADGGAEPGTGQLTRRAKEPTNSLATSHSGIPAPVVSAAEKCLNTATSSADAAQRTGTDDTVGSKSSYADPEIWAKYLTLGAYGSSWMGWGKKEPKERSSILRQESNDGTKAVKPEDHGSPPIEPSLKHIEPQPEGASEEAKLAQQRHLETSGHFVIGLKGDLTLENSDEHMDTYSSGGSSESGGSRTLLRTLYVETADGRRTNYEDDDGERGAINRETITPSDSVSSGPKYQRMRVLVYVHRPFIYTLLFEQRTPSLSMSSFYHNLRHHFIPLHKALCSSTSPSKVAHRIVDARTSPPQPESINPKHPPYDPPKNSPIFDLVFDPRTLTVHTSIPNIPEPGTSAAEGISTTSTRKDTPPRWTRLEALNVHVQILNTLASTRRATHDLERTCKTSRGWWVVWMRLPPSAQGEDAREAFLVRKASDYIAPVGKTSRVSSGMFGLGGRSEQARSGGRGPGSLADGIGIDARRYVEGLLSLNR